MFYRRCSSIHVGGGNTAMSKTSIGIEISNIGYLKKSGPNYITAYGTNDIYCGEEEASFYKKLTTPFREQKIFATYTNVQYNSIFRLLKHLTQKHPKINRTLLDLNKRFEYLTDPAQLKGIVSHINFRESGKWDIGPGFEWSRIEGVVNN
jgi:N-acetylmuramoyl-L-alanine amidase